MINTIYKNLIYFLAHAEWSYIDIKLNLMKIIFWNLLRIQISYMWTTVAGTSTCFQLMLIDWFWANQVYI